MKQLIPKVSQKLITPDNHTLVMIDHQSQMTFAVKSITTEELKNNVGLVAGASKIFNVPTVITTVARKSFSGPLLKEITDVYPDEAQFIDRTSMNTWEDVPAYNAIVGKGHKKIVFCGLWTEVCIVFPVLCAIDEGYDVYVITDACGAVSPSAQAASMQRMIQAGAQPMSSLQYLLELQRDWARHETYVAVNNLVMKYGGAYGVGVQYAKDMFNASEGRH